ncbi:hypothetical protein [Hymenobacter jeollabukensis]|uniref:Uncharacterized protein n=1 Tax=Hymenobacter jeollabukensis TaxID=2025313 RepID=A0A5R8WT14_9BACT|nr:hypothetical protein [Hymenobacter jeollabukensis]TLM94323.1 hypothetical protein FDY95_09990 [Hymenobacter jeollabukensis]
MRVFAYSLLVLAIGLSACESPKTAATEVGDETVAAPPPAQSTPNQPTIVPANVMSPSEAQNPSDPPPGQQYRLLGVIDPDMNNIVAFALKVPRDWQVQQSFKRKWNGAIPSPQVYLSFRSPDGSQQIEYLPAVEYTYADGPMAQNMRAQMQSMGMPRMESELPPMPALTYIKRVLLPTLAQRGLVLRNVTNETVLPAQQAANQVTKTSAYVDGELGNGRRARIECRLSQQTMQANGETYYAWNVIPSITQTNADLAASYAHAKAAQESITMNPTWVKLNNDVVQRGQRANYQTGEDNLAAQRRMTEIQRQGHEQRMADIQRQGAASTARYNDHMAAMDADKAAFDARTNSQDQQHEYFVDAIREKEKYADPSTGERVKVDAGYNHVYTDRQGHYYGSNTPVNAGSVDWQELQKLSMKQY